MSQLRDTDHSERPSRSGSQLAQRNEAEVLRQVALFGHLRAHELARILWPKAASPESAYEMARRTLSRMVSKGLLLERLNAVGGKSHVLTSRGADLTERYWGRGLRLWSDEPRGDAIGSGYDLTSIRGGTFTHRTVTVAYAAMAQGGVESGRVVWGEHAISKNWGPCTEDELRKHWCGKLPDAALLDPHRPTTRCLDWIETEVSIKPSAELKRVLKIAWLLGRPLTPESYVRVDRLVIVYDEGERHEKRILRTALEVAREQADEEAQADPQRRLADDAPYRLLIDRYKSEFTHVDLVRARILPPLRVVAFQATTLYDALTEMYRACDTTGDASAVRR